VRPGAARHGAGGATLRVRSLSVAPPYEERGFVYRTSDLGYESDFYHEFLVTPRSMLTEQVRQWLDASGLFSAVIDSASKAEATHTLEGHVSALYGDVRDKASPKAVLSIEFSLLNHRPGAPEIVFRRRYHQETPADNRSPEALARAWSKGLAQILDALEVELAKVDSVAR
jgi:cholesterol transport system auxiliary component